LNTELKQECERDTKRTIKKYHKVKKQKIDKRFKLKFKKKRLKKRKDLLMPANSAIVRGMIYLQQVLLANIAWHN
jgi:hypothetical protein